MNKEMRKFYRKLNKMENIGVIFQTYNGKLISSEEATKLNLPEGYSIFNNEIFHENEKVGEFELYADENDDEIDLDEFDIDELSEDKKVDSDKTLDFSSYDEDDELDITDDLESDEMEVEEPKKDKKVSIFGKIGYFFKKVFERDTDDFDSDFDDLDEEEDLDIDEEEEIDIADDLGSDEIETKAPRKSIFKRIGQAIGFGISKFFNHFGKKNEVEIPEDVIVEEDKKESKKPAKDEDFVEKELDEEEVKKEKDDSSMKNIEIMGRKFSEIETILREIDNIKKTNPDLSFDNFEERISNERNIFESLFNKYVNNEEVNAIELIQLKSRLTVLKGEIEKYVIDSRLNENKEETKKEIEKETNKSRKFTFTSIEDTKAKFEEYDKPEREFKEIEEKIAYYEEFLKTHDLSHADDQGMKERMESKLATLKEKYNEIMESKKDKTAENNLRTEKMAFYTQTAMGIDKAIENNEIERQIRLLRFRQDPNTIELDAEETRGFYTRKEELEALKAECLKRKAEVNKYYEEQAALMTKALKR